jgi:pimeloyl-ACP methyl ester carboxylesterase
MTPAIDTFTSPATDAGNGLHEGYVEVADVRLRYVDAGDRPLVVLLHGFPEFWYGWPSARRAVPPGAGGSIRLTVRRLATPRAASARSRRR